MTTRSKSNRNATAPNSTLPFNMNTVPSNMNFEYTAIIVPLNWTPPKNIDRNCPKSLLCAVPMETDGAKQSYTVWISLFFTFSRTGVPFSSF